MTGQGMEDRKNQRHRESQKNQRNQIHRKFLNFLFLKSLYRSVSHALTSYF